jgi:peptidoglycan/xylan/chitin deacetylase (PgdA/CDA1 family)
MRDNLKRGFLLVCKWLGLFRLARFATRRGLRILCYHGFAFSDESDFRPKLFMRPETFQIRMRYLSRNEYPVVTLEEACVGLAKGNLSDCAVVITIDDGFFGVSRSAWPVLQMHSFPATVYITSYYAEKQNPVFRLAVQYMFWKTAHETLNSEELGLSLSGVLPLQPHDQKEKTMWEIIHFGESRLDERRRCALACELGKRLDVAYSSLVASRNLSLMNPREISNLAEEGMDIQLHTHRHQLPNELEHVQREILQNREYLEPLARKKLRHLCYPSGIWSPQQWPWLESMGILSATTCDPGLNYAQAPRLGLRRFLDGENVSQIEFEAELSGFSELLRSARSVLRWVNHLIF